jgi:hypothetical protein
VCAWDRPSPPLGINRCAGGLQQVLRPGNASRVAAGAAAEDEVKGDGDEEREEEEEEEEDDDVGSTRLSMSGMGARALCFAGFVCARARVCVCSAQPAGVSCLFRALCV